MSEYIANTDIEITATPGGAWSPGDPNSPAAATQVRSPADGAFAPSGKAVLCDKVEWVMIPGTACTFAGHTFIAGGSALQTTPGLGGQPISATAQKVKANSGGILKAVLRYGDSGRCNGTFTNNSSGATVPCNCNFQITSAGQSKVQAA